MVESLEEQIVKLLSMKVPERETANRAVTYIKTFQKAVSRDWKIVLDTPKLEPCLDGSISAHWKTEVYEILLNVPTDGPAHYSADFRERCEGDYDLTSNRKLTRA